MQTQTTPKQAPTPTTTVTDLKSLRLPANYGATLGVKKLLNKVLVGKLKKHQFFRTHISDEMTFPAMILENKEARESYRARMAPATRGMNHWRRRSSTPS